MRKFIKHLRFYFIIFLLFVLFIIYYIYITESQIFLNSKIINFISKGWIAGKSGPKMCKFPNLNPWSPSIIKEFKLPEVIPNFCTKSREYLRIFETTDDHLIYTGVEEFSTDKYCYKQIVPNGESFSKLEDEFYGIECHKISESNMTISKNHHFISIFESKNLLKPIDVFAFVHTKNLDKKDKNSFLKTLENQYNILILGIDSCSALNFDRTMPKSRQFLDNLGALRFNGYMKVGDSSFDNLIPLMTGLSVGDLRRSCWSNTQDTFDKCQFLWQDYSAQGYVTSSGEENPSKGWMNEGIGFKNVTTDYNFKPFLFVQKTIRHENMLCSGPRLWFSDLLTCMKKFTKRMNLEGRKYFQFLWENTLMHDDSTFGVYGDDPLVQSLQWLLSGRHLDNTILVLLSDHGARYGKIRSTYQGRIEEMMPFLYIHFPLKFKQKYKIAYKNLQINSHRLTSHFDLYETLKDLTKLDQNLNNENITIRKQQLLLSLEKPNLKKKMKKGQSLFLPIDPYRTCQVAGIEEHWCVCYSSIKAYDLNNFEIKLFLQTAVDYILEKLNEKLQITDVRSKCADLSLSEIISAQKLSTEDSTFNTVQVISLVFRVSPSGGEFDATVLYDEDKDEFEISGQVSRINMYGNQSDCISDAKLKLYCHCI